MENKSGRQRARDTFSPAAPGPPPRRRHVDSQECSLMVGYILDSLWCGHINNPQGSTGMAVTVHVFKSRHFTGELERMAAKIPSFTQSFTSECGSQLTIA
jgi:hypothetical protein